MTLITSVEVIQNDADKIVIATLQKLCCILGERLVREGLTLPVIDRRIFWRADAVREGLGFAAWPEK